MCCPALCRIEQDYGQALFRTALDFFLQNLYEDEYVRSSALRQSAGIYRRIRNRIRKYFMALILGLDVIDWRKKTEGLKSRDTVSLREVAINSSKNPSVPRNLGYTRYITEYIRKWILSAEYIRY
jgi:hypothetical protein